MKREKEKYTKATDHDRQRSSFELKSKETSNFCFGEGMVG